jgi:UDP-galactopyranose mutase
MNKYGAHLFHTNKKNVFDYIQKFSKWIRWEHKVLSFVNDRFVSIPANISTVNELLNENLIDEKDMKKWLKNNQIKYKKIKNSEQMAKSRMGIKLYNLLIKDYTFKQWKKYPSQLKPSVLARIPVRDNFDTRYFSDKYQYLPSKGYTHFFKNLLKSKYIKVKLNTDFLDFKKKYDLSNITIIFTGPIDHYFSEIGYEKLEYRSINFKIKKIKNINYYQPNSVVNYPEKQYPFTRIVEYKHFLNQKSKDTIITSETTTDKGEPYYPIPNKRNMDLYEKYKKLALKEEENNIYFLGRMANYKYINMDVAIDNSLNFFKNKII